MLASQIESESAVSFPLVALTVAADVDVAGARQKEQILEHARARDCGSATPPLPSLGWPPSRESTRGKQSFPTPCLPRPLPLQSRPGRGARGEDR